MLVCNANSSNNLFMILKPKIVIIGAGSLSHGKRLIDDLLTIEEFSEGSLFLVGKHLPSLKVIGSYAERVARILKPCIKIIETDELSFALDGADIVITTFDVGGYAAFNRDFSIIRNYHLDACIGDTAGPLGAFRALRNGALMAKIAQTMKEECPQALLINYSNPMAPLISIASGYNISSIGICGGIEATRTYVSNILGIEKDMLQMHFAGINHLCWLLDIQGKEGDLYPRFRALMQNPEIRGNEAVRFEILQQFGYFVSESSGHISDFFSYFRRNDELRNRYCSSPGYSGSSGAYLKLLSFLHRRIGNVDYLEGAQPNRKRSSDHGISVIEAWITNKGCSVYGNVMNSNSNRAPALPNLPVSSCVEIPIELNGQEICIPQGIHLPVELASLCTPLALEHILVAESLMEMNVEKIFAALAIDPLTSSILDLPSIRKLTADLLAANKEWLPSSLAEQPLRATVEVRSTNKIAHKTGDSPELDLVRNYEKYRKTRKANYEPNHD
jgi:alpha-galactosidase